MKKQFDLNYYLEHPETKVVTRDGHNVRIISTDFRDPGFPVVAFISRDDLTEFISCLTISGGMYAEKKDDLDLFFDLPDPVKKKVALTYEDLRERVKAGKTMWLISASYAVFNIVDFDAENVYYIQGEFKEIVPVSYNCLFVDEGSTFVDGTPCWKEVEE